MNKLFFICCILFPVILSAKSKEVYNVLEYGVIPDGITLTTATLQKVIDEASASGGGTVFVPAGDYLISPVQLKSNVELYLAEGATLWGSTDRSDYNLPEEFALVYAVNQRNIRITGYGVIDGRGAEVAESTRRLIVEGVIKESEYLVEAIKKVYAEGGDFSGPHPRPRETNRPQLVAFHNCSDIYIEGVTLKNSTTWTNSYKQCDGIQIRNIRIEATAFWNNDGIDLSDCTNVHIAGCTINAADDGICLKSHDGRVSCENIVIENCTIRSSASGVKFGTASFGGFRNITIRNIYVYDTFRSAIALESVDGGLLENVDVSNIRAINTGNAIFIRLGNRTGNHEQGVRRSPEAGTLKNISIRNLYCEVPAGKPDKGYPIEGPPVREPHNAFPSSISGIPGHPVENVILENIEISFPGGADRAVAYLSPDDLDKVPEKAADYPEFSMFGELPAWAFFIRHVDGLRMNNVNVSIRKEDYRHPFVLDDVKNLSIENLRTNVLLDEPWFFRNVTRYQLINVAKE